MGEFLPSNSAFGAEFRSGGLLLWQLFLRAFDCQFPGNSFRISLNKLRSSAGIKLYMELSGFLQTGFFLKIFYRFRFSCLLQPGRE